MAGSIACDGACLGERWRPPRTSNAMISRHSPATAVQFLGVQAESCQTPVDVAKIYRNPGRNLPKCGPNRSHLVEVGPGVSNVVQHGPSSTDVGPASTNLARSLLRIDQSWPEIGQMPPT